MSFCKSDQKSMPMVGFLTRNDSDILRAKTGPYRHIGYQTNIPPTTEVCGGVRKGAQGGAQAMKGQVGKKAGPGRSARVPRSWNLGKMVWWGHRKYSNHRIIGATRAGLW